MHVYWAKAPDGEASKVQHLLRSRYAGVNQLQYPVGFVQWELDFVGLQPTKNTDVHFIRGFSSTKNNLHLA